MLLPVPMPTNLVTVVVYSRPNFLMVVDRVLVPVVLEVEVLLLVVLLVSPSVSSMPSSVLLERVCNYLEFCCVLDLLHVCTSGMPRNCLKPCRDFQYYQSLDILEMSRRCRYACRSALMPWQLG